MENNTLSAEELKKIIEAMLFAATEPLTLSKIKELLSAELNQSQLPLRKLLDELKVEYQNQRAFRLDEIAEGLVLRTESQYHPYIERLNKNKRTEKLSHAAAEVLAIIAYRQPITRAQVEAIRGVDSSGIIAQLLERNLIQIVGKLEAPGRPTLYGITKEFLQHFGLRNLKDLPVLA